MAYKQKRTSSKSRSRNTRSSSRKSTASRSSGQRSSRSRGSSQTIRIVVEAPQAQSSGPSEGFSMPANNNAPRKAVF